MFTGIIDHIATLVAIEPIAAGLKLQIKTQFTTLKLGESIAVDGACLTVCDINADIFSVELSKITLTSTIANTYRVGQQVNLERSIQAGERFGGHFVTGHVDKTVLIKHIRSEGDFNHWIIGPFDDSDTKFLVEKGSLCINGVSLTITSLEAAYCHLMLIPHTLACTTLANAQVNQHVNIEFDMLAKLVAKQTLGATHEHTF